MISPDIIAACKATGFTEPFIVCERWYGFPPGGVMPIPIPSLEITNQRVLRLYQEYVERTGSNMPFALFDPVIDF